MKNFELRWHKTMEIPKTNLKVFMQWKSLFYEIVWIFQNIRNNETLTCSTLV